MNEFLSQVTNDNIVKVGKTEFEKKMSYRRATKAYFLNFLTCYRVDTFKMGMYIPFFC